MHLFKANTFEVEFDRHLEHMFSYQEMQSGLSVFFGGVNSALSRFSCNRDCLAKSNFSYFSNWKHKN